MIQYQLSIWTLLLVLAGIINPFTRHGLVGVSAQGSLLITQGDYIIYGTVGRTLVIDCSVPVKLFNSSTQWFRDSQALELDQRLSIFSSNGSLVMGDFTPSDTGNYTCSQTNTSGTIVSYVIQIRTAVTTPISFTEGTVELTQGDSIRLECPIEGWLPHPTVYNWYRNSQFISNSQDYRYSWLYGGRVMHIVDVDTDYVGLYSCSAAVSEHEEYMSSSENSISVTVSNITDSNTTESERTYSVLSHPAESLTVMSGHVMLIECFINSANGESVTWMLQGRTGVWHTLTGSNEDVTIVRNQYISWKNYRLSGDRRFRCVVRSADGSELARYQTLVSLQEPLQYSSMRLIPISIDNTREGSMDCPLPYSYPKSTTSRQWLKDGEVMEICHNKKVLDNGSLRIEHVSYAIDSGIYQCVMSNELGSISFTYLLTVRVSAFPPPVPLITSAEFIAPALIGLKWEVCPPVPMINELEGDDGANSNIIAFSINYAQELCLPEILTINRMTGPDLCDLCESRSCYCCEDEQEVIEGFSNYTLQITAYNHAGGVVSQPVRVIASARAQPKPLLPLGLTVLDFDSAVLIRWDRVETSIGYRITVIQRPAQGGPIKSEVTERTSTQNYLFIPGILRNMTWSVEVEAVKAPPLTHVQRIENITPTSLRDAPVTDLEIVALTGGEQANITSRGVMLFWTGVKTSSGEAASADYYYLWYKCDDKETLINVTSATHNHLVDDVDSRCSAILAPVVNGVAGRAAIARYDRWCKSIPQPVEVTVTGQKSKDDGSEIVVVKWNVSTPPTDNTVADDEHCEVNYQVRWKLASDGHYIPPNTMLIKSGREARIDNLAVDFSYNFQVLAFTNPSDDMRTSNVVTYTVGPPLNAKNLAIDQSRYPEGPIVVTWSSPQASHEITFYTLELSMFVMENGLGDFKKINTTVVRVVDGVSLSQTYYSLKMDSTYQITITTRNEHGQGGASSRLFSTPVLINPPGLIATTEAVSRIPDIYIGVIVGVAVAFLFIFLSIMLCIILKRRFKDTRRRRHRRTRHMATPSTEQHPLTVETSMMSYETPSRRLQNGHCIIQEQNETSSASAAPTVLRDSADIETQLPPLRALGSPLQLSLKATSAQDSGIGGTAEDHRSSQDLGEYDEDETDRLMNSSSNTSINSATSSNHSPLSRWSCEMKDISILSLKSPRVHKESESDSLLTDPHNKTCSGSNSTYNPHTAAAEDKPTNIYLQRNEESSGASNSDYHSLISEPPDQQSLLPNHSITTDGNSDTIDQSQLSASSPVVT